MAKAKRVPAHRFYRFDVSRTPEGDFSIRIIAEGIIHNVSDTNELVRKMHSDINKSRRKRRLPPIAMEEIERYFSTLLNDRASFNYEDPIAQELTDALARYARKKVFGSMQP